MKERIEVIATAITLLIKRFRNSARCPKMDNFSSLLLISSLTFHISHEPGGPSSLGFAVSASEDSSALSSLLAFD